MGDSEARSVDVAAGGSGNAASCPTHYFEPAALHLYHRAPNDFSVDERGAAKYGRAANVPGHHVQQLQADLMQLGYLPTGADDGAYGPGTRRAVTRFQRHARRVYRLPGPDLELAEVFQGSVNGECDRLTAQEVQRWLARGWRLPLGRFPLTPLEVPGVVGGQLRSDAAAEWQAIVQLVHAAGGTLRGPYGDTTRNLRRSIASHSAGASGYSFHYCGRAVDINQALAGGRGMRYYLAQELGAARTYWRIYCKTELQEGSQGTQFARGQVRCWLPYTEATYDLPQGYYLDLTALIESRGSFQRIAAQPGFDNPTLDKRRRQQKLEWWHFHYGVDKQATFLDELELIGHNEAAARTGGWTTVADLDHPPG